MDSSNGEIRVLTGCQLRMSRAALKWSAGRLASEAQVSEKTIRRMEALYGPIFFEVESIRKVYEVLVAQGFIFIPDDGDPKGPGVRWANYPGRLRK
jgi:hypothetical protein